MIETGLARDGRARFREAIAGALDRTRDEVGNAWMRGHIVPHLTGGTEQLLGEAVASYAREDAS